MRANTTLEIDINIIKDNYIRLKQLTSSEVAAAVKANAYGLGATQITNALISKGCKIFFVANLSEALELRKLSKNIIIYVLNGLEKGEEKYFHQYNIIPVINHLGQLEVMNNFCIANNFQYISSLHIETGMNRLGMVEKEVQCLISNPEHFSHIKFEYIMSHLACSEEIDNNFNQIQLDNFKRLYRHFPTSKASLANSGGVLLGKEYHFDLIRSGAAIYGLNLNYAITGFHNPISLYSELIQIKEVNIGETIGYSQTYHLDKDSIIGTIPIGYADGISRHLSNNGYCYINNIATPIIGRVSMDLITIDLTNIPENFRKLGQKVELIGKNQTPDQLARGAGTIGYEILTSLGTRYDRKYVENQNLINFDHVDYQIMPLLNNKENEKLFGK